MAKTTSKPTQPAVPGWLPYTLGGLVLAIGLLLALLPWGNWIPWLSISLHSLLDADYSPDLYSTRFAPPRLALAAEALQDQAYTQNTGTPGDYLATLQTGLLTPVVTVTPRPGETLFPLTSPTYTPGLSSPFPGATQSPTFTATPTWTPTGTRTLTTTPTPTLGPGTSLPSPTRGPTQAPTRRPTNPGPGQPTATPSATRTTLPTATETMRPTLAPPTATAPPPATPTRQPTATERPYPPPPYP